VHPSAFYAAVTITSHHPSLPQHSALSLGPSNHSDYNTLPLYEGRIKGKKRKKDKKI
jgi:hypothetical protein